MALTRRNFLEVAGAAGAAAMIAACDSNAQTEEPAADSTEEEPAAEPATDEPAAETETEPEPEQAAWNVPDPSEYPIDPDGDDVEAKYEITETDNFFLVTQEDGAAELGTGDEAKLIQVDGYAFKDLNGNGKLDIWEDWRQDTTTRAQAFAEQLDIELCLAQLTSGGLNGSMTGELLDSQKEVIDKGFTNRIKMTFSEAIKDYVPWFNALQAYAEDTNAGIPITFECEAFQGMSTMGMLGLLWPSMATLAATFDKQNAWEIGNDLALCMRAYGGTKPNSPQTDVGTEPTWDRNSGTWSDDPALCRDMCNGFCSGMQSTYDEDGNDLGWGKHSMICNMKHFPGDGSCQFGRNSHNAEGQYDIYPNDANRANWVPFIDGGLNLDSKTGQVGSAMPYYSIAYSEDGRYGENVGGGFSEYIMSVGRAYGFEGIYSSDWGILGQRPWGVEDLTQAERLAKSYQAGMCLMVDDAVYNDGMLDEAYGIMKEWMGDAEAEERVRDSVMRIERSTMNLGLFENPFLQYAESAPLVKGKAYEDKLQEILLKGIVMVKNDDVLKEGGIGDKAKVYVPRRFSNGSADWFMVTDTGGTANLPVTEDFLSERFDWVTDTVGEPTGADGSLQESDVIRASDDELKDCEYAIVVVSGPNTNATDNGDGTYNPRSLQYRSFVADESYNIPKPATASPEGEDYSPAGGTGSCSNENDLDLILDTKKRIPSGCKLIVCVGTENPVMCFHEFEPEADCILWAEHNNDENFFRIIAGEVEPSGLLPWQMPLDMKAAYNQATDLPRDMECYVDSMGNTYDFGFGLNWSGVIQDERTEKYCVDPLLEPEMEIDESKLIK